MDASVETPAGWRFDNSYTRLSGRFFVRQVPSPVANPRLVILNRSLANALGLEIDWLSATQGVNVFSGNALPEGADPIAQAYAGHQFGCFTMLGDGRAILLGEHLAPHDLRFDIQLKGAGRTPFSRRGDGRAALGPMLREYIISEAMHALGIPTTRSLAVVTTGEPVYRERPWPGAVLTRVAASHLRVGTFEYAAATGEPETLRQLADYAIWRHYPDCRDAENPYLAFLEAVVDRQAALVASWMQVGFIHGVMNTDNMSICGETIDYGPCAFMDAYDPATVLSAIDRAGRYAYANQPRIAQWNLARFAETLLPLLHAKPETAVSLAEQAVQAFGEHYRMHWLAGMRAKLGLVGAEANDQTLIEDLLTCMTHAGADFTNTFRDLALEVPLPDALEAIPDFRDWRQRWHARRARQALTQAEARRLMLSHSPAVIPRNHRVEQALDAAVEHGDLAPLHRLLEALAAPYEDVEQHQEYRRPPAPEERVLQTFCGT